jgi:hypothetical protein
MAARSAAITYTMDLVQGRNQTESDRLFRSRQKLHLQVDQLPFGFRRELLVAMTCLDLVECPN